MEYQEHSKDKRNSRGYAPRETRWLDLINVIIALSMLYIAYATYRVAKDSRDIHEAILNISDLVSQTKRQADGLDKEVSQLRRSADAGAAEATALREQLNEMKTAQRPWISLDMQPDGPLIHDATGWHFIFKYEFDNVGNSPASNVQFLAL